MKVKKFTFCKTYNKLPIIFYDYGKKLSWKKIFNFKKTVESLERINSVKLLILTLVITKNDLWDFFL